MVFMALLDLGQYKNRRRPFPFPPTLLSSDQLITAVMMAAVAGQRKRVSKETFFHPREERRREGRERRRANERGVYHFPRSEASPINNVPADGEQEGEEEEEALL